MTINLPRRKRKPTPPIAASDLVDAISVENLAESLHSSKQTLYDEMNSGDLPSFLLGGRRYIRLSAWRAFCAKREQASALPSQRGGHRSASSAA